MPALKLQRKFHDNHHQKDVNDIFVFGSNLSGIHGGGAAAYANNALDAAWKVGIGPTGRCYALPTKDFNVRDPLPLERVREHVKNFIAYAEEHPELTFFVTRVGCGLAGFTDAQMGPLFSVAPLNCVFPPEWKEYSDLGLDVVEATATLRMLEQFAYTQGMHELGYDPIDAFVTAHTRWLQCLKSD